MYEKKSESLNLEKYNLRYLFKINFYPLDPRSLQSKNEAGILPAGIEP